MGPVTRSLRALSLGLLSLDLISVAFATSLWAQERAQDVVIVSSPTDPAAQIKKQGQILDYTGIQLTLRTPLGRDELIPAGRVVEIQTTWSEPHQAGDAAREAGNLDEAIAAYRQAKRVETRPWAVRRIMAELVGCYAETGRLDSAGDEFLAIASSDPATPHFNVVPIAWRSSLPDAALETRAVAWLAAKQMPAAVVLGASWLLAGPRRGEAVAALEGLRGSSDSRVAALANIQLWRLRLVTATPEEARRWQAQLEAMPPEVQASGWFILGDVLARQQQADRAALAYLKVPLLFRSQRAMAADALLAAGRQLEKLGQTNQAASLYREIARDFPHLPVATEAKTQLGGLTAKPAP